MRAFAAPGLDQNFQQGCQGFQTAMTHRRDGRKPFRFHAKCSTEAVSSAADELLSSVECTPSTSLSQ